MYLKLNRNVLHHFEVRHPSRYPLTIIHSIDVILDIQPTCYLQRHSMFLLDEEQSG